uniref:Regulator of G protein signaling 13 n=1 Tax=Sparus aurata TaxID=8175 RepID=A0A671VRP2_SPAAU
MYPSSPRSAATGNLGIKSSVAGGTLLSVSQPQHDQDREIKAFLESREERGCYLSFMLGVFSLFTSDGLATFRNFLKSEYSDENIEFWLTCEDYKKIKSSFRMSSRAKKIYEQFIKAESPKEVRLFENIAQPGPNCFDRAQSLIYGLMENDCYPRFLKSEIYQALLEQQ